MIGVISNMKNLVAVCLLLFVSSGVLAQSFEQDAVRLTGIILDADDRQPVPYASIQIDGTQFGTSSDNSGHFTLFMNPGDTLVFSSVGYRDSKFVMPYTVSSDTYSLIQLMRKETVLLDEVVVFPWPTLQNFERAFLDVNIEKDKMEEVVVEVKRELDSNINASRESKYYYEQMRYQKLYEVNNDFGPNNFLNPMRWSNFIQDVTSGKLKQNKEKED